MHQKMERMFQGARPQASSAPPVKWNERFQLSRKANFKNQGTQWTFQITSCWVNQDIYQDAVLCWDFSSSGLRPGPLQFGRQGINAHSNPPKPRPLNYYFLGSKDRSQQTRPFPLVKVGLKPFGWHNCLCKGSYEHLSLYNLFKLNTDIFKCVRHRLKIGLSLELE